MYGTYFDELVEGGHVRPESKFDVIYPFGAGVLIPNGAKSGNIFNEPELTSQAEERLRSAAEILMKHEGKQGSYIIVAGGISSTYLDSGAIYFRKRISAVKKGYLMYLGVDERDIVDLHDLIPESDKGGFNTFREVELFRYYSRLCWKPRVLMVTHELHMPRANLIAGEMFSRDPYYMYLMKEGRLQEPFIPGYHLIKGTGGINREEEENYLRLTQEWLKGLPSGPIYGTGYDVDYSKKEMQQSLAELEKQYMIIRSRFHESPLYAIIKK